MNEHAKCLAQARHILIPIISFYSRYSKVYMCGQDLHHCQDLQDHSHTLGFPLPVTSVGLTPTTGSRTLFSVPGAKHGQWSPMHTSVVDFQTYGCLALCIPVTLPSPWPLLGCFYLVLGHRHSILPAKPLLGPHITGGPHSQLPVEPQHSQCCETEPASRTAPTSG